MPEGNEIHRWAERHAAAFAGKTVRVDGPQGRFTDADLLDGRKLRRVMAVGKHLGYDFGKDRILHVHLGLQGDFTEGSGELPAVKGALRLRMWNAAAVRKAAREDKAVVEEGGGGAALRTHVSEARHGAPGSVVGTKGPVVTKRHAWYSEDDGTGNLRAEEIAWVELRGPMDCSVWTEAQWETLLRRLGPDPLNGDGSERALERIAKRRKAVGLLLMEQEVMAGIGNIFRAELLFRAGVNPFVEGRSVAETQLKKIWKDAVGLMRAGMVDRRIVTTRAKDRPSKKAGQALKEEAHYVYRRQGRPCLVCGTAVRKMENFAGRNLYWCEVCQAEKG
jgi:endonuclease-8